MSNTRLARSPFTRADRKILEAAGLNARPHHEKRSVVRQTIELDYGDGDVRKVYAEIKKMSPTMFQSGIEKAGPFERFRTLAEALQHIEDKKTCMIALGVLDPALKQGRDTRKQTVAEWANNRSPNNLP
jgi:hypothetical protein